MNEFGVLPDNILTVCAQIVERKPVRWTPAGSKAVEVVLMHESQQGNSKLGQPHHRVSFSIDAVAFDRLADRLERLDMGRLYRFVGYLNAKRAGKGIRLLLTQVETGTDVSMCSIG
jgi:primosomal replication protein N